MYWEEKACKLVFRTQIKFEQIWLAQEILPCGSVIILPSHPICALTCLDNLFLHQLPFPSSADQGLWYLKSREWPVGSREWFGEATISPQTYPITVLCTELPPVVRLLLSICALSIDPGGWGPSKALVELPQIPVFLPRIRDCFCLPSEEASRLLLEMKADFSGRG